MALQGAAAMGVRWPTHFSSASSRQLLGACLTRVSVDPSAQAIALVAHALGKMNVPVSDLVPAPALPTSSPSLPSPQSSSARVLVAGTSGTGASGWSSLLAAVVTTAPDMSAKNLINLLWGLSAMGAKWVAICGDAQEALLTSLGAVAPSLTPRGLVTVLTSLTKMEIDWNVLTEDLSPSSSPVHPPSFSASRPVHTLWKVLAAIAEHAGSLRLSAWEAHSLLQALRDQRGALACTDVDTKRALWTALLHTVEMPARAHDNAAARPWSQGAGGGSGARVGAGGAREAPFALTPFAALKIFETTGGNFSLFRCLI